MKNNVNIDFSIKKIFLKPKKKKVIDNQPSVPPEFSDF